jgi:hypothetical protein
MINDDNNRDTSVKNKIINVINLYNPNNIKNEWEKNRKQWYQNNQRFNPIFKINDRNERNQDDRQRNTTLNYESTTYGTRMEGGGDNNNNNGGGPPNGRGGGNGGNNGGNNSRSNEPNLFQNLPDIHSNQ